MKVLASSLIAVSALALLAGGAQAQDRGDRGPEHHGGGGFHGGQPRQQPAAQPQVQPQAQPQAQPQPRPSFQTGQSQGAGQFRGRGAFTGAQPVQAQPQGQAGQFQGQGRAYPQAQYRGQGYQGGAQGYRGQGVQGQTFQGQAYRGGVQAQGFQGRYGQQGQFRGQGGYQQPYRGGEQGRAYGGGGRNFSYRGGYHSAFRASPYRFPGGYSYRRYGIHQRFPSYLLLEPYFLYDYGSYFLSPPPGPEYRWVRYGPDAVLVDTYTGEIEDVAYGVFYDGDDDGGYSY